MHRLHRLLPRVALATSPLLAGGLAATKTPARSQSSATQKTLRVAVVQMLVGSDKATNLKNAERLVNQACDGHADVVVPRGAENAVAIDLLVRGIRERTLERSAQAASSRSPRVIVAP